MNKEIRIAVIDSELEILQVKLEDKNKKYKFNASSSFKEWEEYLKPETDKIGVLDRERRLLVDPEFQEIPDYGDVMSLKNFIDNVKDGGFIDYDGSGNYVRHNQMSDISIYPSDIQNDSIRDDFDTIIWFNR